MITQLNNNALQQNIQCIAVSVCFSNFADVHKKDHYFIKFISSEKITVYFINRNEPFYRIPTSFWCVDFFGVEGKV